MIVLNGLKPKQYWYSKLLISGAEPISGAKAPSRVRNEFLIEKLTFRRPAESEVQYVKRVKSLLPNIPREVIKTWLLEHNSCLDDIVELPIEHYTFNKVHISLKDILNYKPAKNSAIDLNLKQLADRHYCRVNMADPYTPMARILQYIKQNKQWPGRVILLSTKFLPDNYKVRGYEPVRPYEVLEGFRRFSVVKHYCNEDITCKRLLRAFVITSSDQYV